MLHRLLRQEQLCPGGPRQCPEVLNQDVNAGSDALPCPLCPALRLQEFLASPAGQLISNVLELDACLQMGITVTRAEISYPEYLVLRLLHEERARLNNEEIQKSRGRH